MRALSPHEAAELVVGCKRLAADHAFKTTLDLLRQNYADLILNTDAGDTARREELYFAAKGLDALQTQIDNTASAGIVEAQE